MGDSSPEFFDILQLLADHGVDFIVVGNVSAVLHGAPVNTFDLDLVHSRDPANIERLLVVLQKLGAYFRESPERHIQPDASHLLSPGHQLLLTRLGPLDLLGTVGKDLSYEGLLNRTTVLEVSGNLRIRVLNLETLIELKEAVGRDKDKAVLHILRRTLEERRRLDPRTE
jgi:predicted nucleotidyltransferase